jgi:hypothetical protein
MGMGVMGRLAQGLRNTINTVSVGEAYLQKTKEVKAPEKFPELGVLQFGTRFRSSPGQINPFLSGVRPATGPTVARPGIQQFKGTGGAFAPEQGMQITSGMRGLQQPVSKLQALLTGPAAERALSAQNFGSNPEMLAGLQNAPPEVQQAMMQQSLMQNLSQMISMITSMLRASHDVAMNSIRNIKA